jgi:hypothetical protein
LPNRGKVSGSQPVQWLRFFKPQRRQFGGRGPRLPTTSNGPRKSLLRCDDTLFSQTISLLCGVGN